MRITVLGGLVVLAIVVSLILIFRIYVPPAQNGKTPESTT
jgi:hypothetical protein